LTPLKPLLYFSLFKYPLTKSEILAFSGSRNKDETEVALQQLVKENVVYKIDDFYCLDNDPDQVERRRAGNEGAKNIFKKAESRSRFISKFPFVEGVGLSGALSKGFFDKDGDIDFFIITSPGRLWIARTLLILYKKTFLLNSNKYFCVNYFVSENALEITEKNLFTATELVTLIPMYGNGSFHKFYDLNSWAYKQFPNKSYEEALITLKPIRKSRIVRFTQRLLSKSMGDLLDAFLLKLTYKKWKVKFDYLDRDQFNLAMKSTQDVSKHHPKNFQKKVITRLNDKYSEYEAKYDIPLSPEHA
jgi:hypothetical protein